MSDKQHDRLKVLLVRLIALQTKENCKDCQTLRTGAHILLKRLNHACPKENK